jgi:hypothetical protein
MQKGEFILGVAPAVVCSAPQLKNGLEKCRQSAPNVLQKCPLGSKIESKSGPKVIKVTSNLSGRRPLPKRSRRTARSAYNTYYPAHNKKKR